jgi:hypothetical protein
MCGVATPSTPLDSGIACPADAAKVTAAAAESDNSNLCIWKSSLALATAFYSGGGMNARQRIMNKLWQAA